MRKIVVCKLSECPRYLKEMTCLGESATVWQFVCPTCLNSRTISKDQVGGTFGAGTLKEDGTRSVVGRGFS